MQLAGTAVAPNMWQGPCPPSIEPVVDARFTIIAFCAAEIQPPLPPRLNGLRILHVPLTDNPNSPMTDDEWMRAHEAGKKVAKYVLAGGKSLVTCAMGWNRSGIVNAVALHHAFGLSGPQAAHQIKSTRGANALSNPSFMRRLATLPDRRHR